MEHTSDFSNSGVVFFFIFPSVDWVKNLSVDTFDSFWIRKVENWHSIEFRVVDSTIMNSVDDVSGILNGDSLSDSVSSSSPSSVDEPDVSSVLLTFVLQQISINLWAHWHDGLTETG